MADYVVPVIGHGQENNKLEQLTKAFKNFRERIQNECESLTQDVYKYIIQSDFTRNNDTSQKYSQIKPLQLNFFKQ